MRSKEVICNHETAHACLCHYHGIPISYVEVYEEDSVRGISYYDGRCWCDLSDSSDVEEMQMFCAGFALEWHDLSDEITYDRFNARSLVSTGLGSYDDCERIQDLLDNSGTPNESPAHREIIIGLFRETWNILDDHYHQTIVRISTELGSVGKLTGEELNEIFEEEFPIGSPRDDLKSDNSDYAA